MASKEDRQFSEIQRYMNKKKKHQLRLQDNQGYEYTNEACMIPPLQEYYADFSVELAIYHRQSGEAKREICRALSRW